MTLFLLLPCKCNFATVMNCNVNACVFRGLRGTGKGLRTTDLGYVCAGPIEKKECKYRTPFQTLYDGLTILFSTV